MLSHMIHSHLEFRLFMVTLGLMLTILVFYVWVCWREGRRGKAPKFSETLRRRIQMTKQKLKRRHDDQGGAA
jgi:hypothetical protein